jgi:hypothetical protein
MKRREFIVGLGSAAVWPVTAGAQRPPPVVGGLVLVEFSARYLMNLS